MGLGGGDCGLWGGGGLEGDGGDGGEGWRVVMGGWRGVGI